MTILLVDDDPSVLAVFTAVLTYEGYKVLAAGSPALALELATQNVLSMLITDFQMPGMNGFTLATHLTTGRAALPVLIMSGSDPSDVPMAEISKRHWQFISKPIDRQRMLRIIDGECLGWALRLSA